MAPIIITILMLAILVTGIIKGYNIAMVFWLVSTAVLLFLQPFTGQSIMGDRTTGYYILDIFAYIMSTVYRTFNSNLGIIVMVFGYVGYINSIKATDLFAKTLIKPLRKIKHPLVVAGLMMFIGVLLKTVISLSVSLGSVLIATLSPILLGLGLPIATVAVFMFLPMCYVYGPSSSIAYTAFALIGVENYTPVQLFIEYEILPVIVTSIVMIIIAVSTSAHFEKKEAASGAMAKLKQEMDLDESMPDIPKYFAIFPILPLIVLILFSDLFLSIRLDVPAVFIMCFIIALLCVSLQKKSLKQGVNSSVAFFKEGGSILTSAGFNIIGAAVFAEVIDKVGGLKILASALTGFSGAWMFIAVVLLSAIAMLCIPNAGGVVAVIAPIIGAYVRATGANPFPFIVGTNFGILFGYLLCPASMGMNFIISVYDVSPITIIKRNVPTCIGTTAAFIILMLFLHFI